MSSFPSSIAAGSDTTSSRRAGARKPSRGSMTSVKRRLTNRWATGLLLVSNALVFLTAFVYPVGYPFSLSQLLRLDVDAPLLHQYLTFGFSHFGMVHLIMNLILLLLAGGALERRIGSGPMLVIYMAAASLGSALYVSSSILRPALPPAAGGSAPIAALLGAFLYHGLSREGRPLKISLPFVGAQTLERRDLLAIVGAFFLFNIISPLADWPGDFEWALAGINGVLVLFGVTLAWVGAFFAPIPKRLSEPADTADLVSQGGVSEDRPSAIRLKGEPLLFEITDAINALDSDRAWNFFEIWADTTPDPPNATLDVETQWRLALLLVSEQKRERAIDALERLLRRYPYGFCMPRARYELGLLLAERSATRARAIRELRAALDGPPPECPLTLAALMGRLGDTAREFAIDTLTALGDPEYVPAPPPETVRFIEPDRTAQIRPVEPLKTEPIEEGFTYLAHAFGAQPPGGQRGSGPKPPPLPGMGAGPAHPAQGPEDRDREKDLPGIDQSQMDRLFGPSDGTSQFKAPQLEDEPPQPRRRPEPDSVEDSVGLIDFNMQTSSRMERTPRPAPPPLPGMAAPPRPAPGAPAPRGPARPARENMLPNDMNASSIFGSLSGTEASLPIMFDAETGQAEPRKKSAPPPLPSRPAPGPVEIGPAESGFGGRFSPPPPASAPPMGTAPRAPWEDGPGLNTPPPPTSFGQANFGGSFAAPPQRSTFGSGDEDLPGFQPHPSEAGAPPPLPPVEPGPNAAPKPKRPAADPFSILMGDAGESIAPPSHFRAPAPPRPAEPMTEAPPPFQFVTSLSEAPPSPPPMPVVSEAPPLPPVQPAAFRTLPPQPQVAPPPPPAPSPAPEPAPPPAPVAAPAPVADSTRLVARRPQEASPAAPGDDLNFAGSSADQTAVWSSLYKNDRQLRYDVKNRYSVIITPGFEPSAKIIVDVLREFLQMSPQNTLHALKRRHGLLATDLGLKEAQELATSFTLRGQSVSLVEHDTRIKFGDPFDVLMIEFEPGGARLTAESGSRTVRWKNLIALTCGSIQLGSGGGRDVIDLFFCQPSLHYRVWRTTLMSAKPHFSGKREDAPREFKTLAREIGALAPHVIQSHSYFEWMKNDRNETPVAFSNLIEYDNYTLWYLMAHYARIKKLDAQDPSMTSAPTEY